jgi:hypothetical protein
MTTAFAKLATVTASTKRNPASVAGKVGQAVTYLVGLQILPIMPTDEETRLMYKIQSPRVTYVTYVEQSIDIKNGDILVVGAASYKIVGVGKWDAAVAPFRSIILEDVQGT